MASELAAALVKVKPIVRNAEGQVGNKKRKYADLAAVSAVVLPLLAKHGLAFTAWPTLQDGQFALSYSLIHEAGEERTGTYPLPASGNSQQIGGVITYARRYALCAVTGAAPEGEDDDAAGATEIRMDRPRHGPERYAGRDQPHDNTGRVRVPVPGPEHERLRHEPPGNGQWDGEDHWVDQPPGQLDLPAPAKPARRGSSKLTPAQAIVLHFKRLGVDDDTDRLVKTTVLAGRTELLESTTDLDEATQAEISSALGKCRDPAALAALIDAKRAEAAS
jgi:hypothetical protein